MKRNERVRGRELAGMTELCVLNGYVTFIEEGPIFGYGSKRGSGDFGLYGHEVSRQGSDRWHCARATHQSAADAGSFRGSSCGRAGD